MGAITPGRRLGRYTAQIARKRGGAFLLGEAKTFDRERVAVAWLRHREAGGG